MTVAMAGLLGACTARVPLPESRLLAPQPAPSCEYRGAGTAEGRKGDAASVDPAQAAQMKLDYERQCYRHAEMIARAKLQKLQESVERTVLALKAERAGTSAPAPPLAGP